MSPETLIGTELGKSVLQRLLGQGTMGTVYLAYQTHLQRQVAVKVFLPAYTLEPPTQGAFQERLKQEIARGASLEHIHILAILDHGEQHGMVYKVMPYIAGESLQTLLDRSGALPFSQTQQYLEQLAVALDYAHTSSILHGDIKPSNILLTSKGSLLLADFGLAALTTEKAFVSARQPMSGMLNYIAPEYVLGQTVDQRADIYSLGVVLYQMVTGTIPFQGATLNETAMQHAMVAPPSPCLRRTDLPQTAGQVILRALAKDPEHRYSRTQDLATAFRQALEGAQLLPNKEEPISALTMLAELASGGATAKIKRVSAPRRKRTPVLEPPEELTSASQPSDSPTLEPVQAQPPAPKRQRTSALESLEELTFASQPSNVPALEPVQAQPPAPKRQGTSALESLEELTSASQPSDSPTLEPVQAQPPAPKRKRPTVLKPLQEQSPALQPGDSPALEPAQEQPPAPKRKRSTVLKPLQEQSPAPQPSDELASEAVQEQPPAPKRKRATVLKPLQEQSSAPQPSDSPVLEPAQEQSPAPRRKRTSVLEPLREQISALKRGDTPVLDPLQEQSSAPQLGDSPVLEPFREQMPFFKRKRTSVLEPLREQISALKRGDTPVLDPLQGQNSVNEIPISSELTDQSPKSSGPLRFATGQTDTNQRAAIQNQAVSEPVANVSVKPESKQASNTEKLGVAPSGKIQTTTGVLSSLTTLPQNGESTGMFKLTEPVKIIQVPIAGQPGRFVTGILPAVLVQEPSEHIAKTLFKRLSKRLSKRMKIASLLLALAVLIGSGIFFRAALSQSNPVVQKTHNSHVNLSTNATVQAMATMQANIILSDSLSQNIHDWPVGQQGNFTYAFKDGTYHIINNNTDKSASALLSSEMINGPFTYSLTMEQIKGDETSPNNQFGMILYASVQNTGGKEVDKFYTFEVVNKAGGEYQFWKYDNSQTNAGDSPWTKLWNQSFGKEFLQGNGASHANKFKIVATGKMFTFFVNGQQVGSFKDSSFSSGNIGMLVNLDGAEVAFSNLLLAYS